VTDVFSDIKQAYKAHGAVGLTISGGEPFEQAEALRLLLQMCFDDGLTDDILVYSGYDQASLLCRHPWAPKLISALVAGPFDLNLPTKSVWCGSDNQTLAVFKASLHLKYERWRQETSRRMQVIMGSHYIRIIGIPQPEDLEPLGNLIRGAFNEES
jgi:anaerobic ribonucleoside-triphosphate reductase activating protein